MAGVANYVLTVFILLTQQEVSDFMAGAVGSVLTVFTPTLSVLKSG